MTTGYERQAYADLHAIAQELRAARKDGPTLRDLFAMAALAPIFEHAENAEQVARAAYQMADAMLYERDRSLLPAKAAAP